MMIRVEESMAAEEEEEDDEDDDVVASGEGGELGRSFRRSAAVVVRRKVPRSMREIKRVSAFGQNDRIGNNENGWCN